MRYSGDRPNRILMVRTEDGGVHWSPPVKTALPNPNAAIGSALLSDGPLLLVFNNAEENREDLSLALSKDFGNTWRVVHRFEGDSRSTQAPVPEYSYPWIMQDRAGDVHVLYTWGRSRIKHVRFQPGLAGEQALMPANAIFGLLGCGLLSFAAVATLIRLRRLPVRARYAVMVAAALAVFVPIAISRSPPMYGRHGRLEHSDARPGRCRVLHASDGAGIDRTSGQAGPVLAPRARRRVLVSVCAGVDAVRPVCARLRVGRIRYGLAVGDPGCLGQG